MNVNRLSGGVVLFVGIAAITGAVCDFPWYPEYAPIIGQYNEITPVQAKKAAILYNSSFNKGPCVVCEPLPLKWQNGITNYYVVVLFFGHDREVPKKWNKIVSELGKGEKTNATVLENDLSSLRDKAEANDFEALYTGAYDFASPRGAIKRPLPLLFYGKAFNFAKAISNSKIEYFRKLVFASDGPAQIFEFEDKEGQPLFIYVDEGGNPEIADMEMYARSMDERVKHWADCLREPSEGIMKNVKVWSDIDNEISDEVASGELPDGKPGTGLHLLYKEKVIPGGME